jgi:hypothetical protein
MGHMKWIYEMVDNGTISVFRALYDNAVKYKLKAFIFEDQSFDVMRAKAILELAVKAEKEYDAHIEAQFEWMDEVARGR